jgi:hypothetical protein
MIVRYEGNYAPNARPLAYASVVGYRIDIHFAGTFAGNLLLVHAGWEKEVGTVMRQFADFYLAERILPAPEKFRKYIM